MRTRAITGALAVALAAGSLAPSAATGQRPPSIEVIELTGPG